MKKAVPLTILAMFLAGATLQAVRMGWSVGENMQLDFGEGFTVWLASQVFDLKNAFHPLDQYPYIAFVYTPFYFVAVRMVSAIFGDLLLSGRLISMAAALWLAGLFGWAVLRATRGYAPSGVRWFGAILAGACVLQLPTMRWVPFARVDIMGLALQFTALSVVVAGAFRLRNQVVACFLLLLGIYTKQSLIAIPAATILLIGLIRPLRAVWLVCGLLAAGLGILLILARATDGGVIRHWMLYNVNRYHFMEAVYIELGVSTTIPALIAAGLAAFWLAVPGASGKWRSNWRRTVSARLASSPLRRTGVGFGLAAAIGFVVSWGCGKEGATINYCLDWQLALCPLTGVFAVLIGRGWKRQDRGMAFFRPFLAVLLAATALPLAIDAAFQCNGVIGITGTARRVRAEKLGEEADLVRLIASFPGPVVSDNMLALLRAGKPLPFEPAIIRFTTGSGVFDESELLRRTSDRFFDAFIVDAAFSTLHYSPRMLEAIRRNYRLYPFGSGTYQVYVRP